MTQVFEFTAQVIAGIVAAEHNDMVRRHDGLIDVDVQAGDENAAPDFAPAVQIRNGPDDDEGTVNLDLEAFIVQAP